MFILFFANTMLFQHIASGYFLTQQRINGGLREPMQMLRLRTGNTSEPCRGECMNDCSWAVQFINKLDVIDAVDT